MDVSLFAIDDQHGMPYNLAGIGFWLNVIEEKWKEV
jgi:hypothetical protein